MLASTGVTAAGTSPAMMSSAPMCYRMSSTVCCRMGSGMCCGMASARMSRRMSGRASGRMRSRVADGPGMLSRLRMTQGAHGVISRAWVSGNADAVEVTRIAVIE